MKSVLDILGAHRGLFSGEEFALCERLVAEGQGHLFEGWDEVGVADERKRAFVGALMRADGSYPGGLAGYIANARVLLAGAAAGENPYEGCTPGKPATVDLSGFGPEYDLAEEAGLRALAETGIVLVAGGLGERLGYGGIKLDIPVEVTETTSYLAHYAGVIRAASRRLGVEIPLIIMTSKDTNAGTLATLEANGRFGLAEGQVTILCQELVPALSDIDAHLALDGPYELALKPHGHGDIHMLLHTSGVAKRLAKRGVRYLVFIQDTNGQVFNAVLAALGVSEREGYDFNSVAVNRIPGEAVGGIATLKRAGVPDLTINVEYNQLDPLLRSTVSPEGDVPNAQGFSIFPGNINFLVIRMEPYLRILESSRGIIAEFVNPKFAEGSRTTFKKPARLETMMQDLPKLFVSGERVGVTVFERSWCFSACKNNLREAAEKVAKGGPPESASSAENDFYGAGRARLRFAGVEVEEGAVTNIRGIPFVRGPRVILRPGFCLTVADVRERIVGGAVRGDSTLILDGDVRLENVEVSGGAALVVVAAPGASVVVRDLKVAGGEGFQLEELSEEEMESAAVPEFLRIRGYRIRGERVLRVEVSEGGRWELTNSGLVRVG